MFLGGVGGDVLGRCGDVLGRCRDGLLGGVGGDVLGRCRDVLLGGVGGDVLEVWVEMCWEGVEMCWEGVEMCCWEVWVEMCWEGVEICYIKQFLSAHIICCSVHTFVSWPASHNITLGHGALSVV